MKDLLIGALVLIVVISAAGVVYWKKTTDQKKAKTVMIVNTVLVLGILMTSTIVMFAGGRAFAAEVETAAGVVADTADNGLRYLAAALSTGLATIGTGIAVAASASAALGAISEDSSLLGKTIIFVGLAEGIAIYGLIVSILILP
ncbi:MAG: ATPase [Clostridia bacterium]|nr:ATPase [Clostridia bacterium]MBN2882072.1 ATPase [Clostridia bacterium]